LILIILVLLRVVSRFIITLRHSSCSNCWTFWSGVRNGIVTGQALNSNWYVAIVCYPAGTFHPTVQPQGFLY